PRSCARQRSGARRPTRLSSPASASHLIAATRSNTPPGRSAHVARASTHGAASIAAATIQSSDWGLGTGDWGLGAGNQELRTKNRSLGLGAGDWGLNLNPNP